MNEEDMILRALHETMNAYLKAAENAPNEEDRQEYLLQVKQTARDVENYYDEIAGVSAKPESLPEPIPVNHRREAILAQRARSAA